MLKSSNSPLHYDFDDLSVWYIKVFAPWQAEAL